MNAPVSPRPPIDERALKRIRDAMLAGVPFILVKRSRDGGYYVTPLDRAPIDGEPSAA